MGWWWVLVAVGAAAVLVGLDRAVAHGWFDRRVPRPRPSAGGPSGFLGELVEVFQPGRRHRAEEQDRRRADAVQTPAAAPTFEVDLDAGTATLRRPGEPAAPADVRTCGRLDE